MSVLVEAHKENPAIPKKKPFCVEMEIYPRTQKNRSAKIFLDINFYIENLPVAGGELSIGITRGRLSFHLANAAWPLRKRGLKATLPREIRISTTTTTGLEYSQSATEKASASLNASNGLSCGGEINDADASKEATSTIQTYSHTESTVTAGGTNEAPFWDFKTTIAKALEGGRFGESLGTLDIKGYPCQITAEFTAFSRDLWISGHEGVWPKDMNHSNRMIRQILIWIWLKPRVKPHLNAITLELGRGMAQGHEAQQPYGPANSHLDLAETTFECHRLGTWGMTDLSDEAFKQALGLLNTTTSNNLIELISLVGLNPLYDLEGANLAGANLAGLNLAKANLARADLSGANLAGTTLKGADLTEAVLAGANLTRANLSDANLVKADISNANLIWANLGKANLMGANLIGAKLRGTNLMGVTLAGACYTQATLAGAKYRKSQLDYRVNFRAAMAGNDRAALMEAIKKAREPLNTREIRAFEAVRVVNTNDLRFRRADFKAAAFKK